MGRDITKVMRRRAERAIREHRGVYTAEGERVRIPRVGWW